MKIETIGPNTNNKLLFDRLENQNNQQKHVLQLRYVNAFRKIK